MFALQYECRKKNYKHEVEDEEEEGANEKIMIMMITKIMKHSVSRLTGLFFVM